MKKYTHAWIAFKAIERLEKAALSDADTRFAVSLVRWFKNRKDGVVPGAWYPDEIIKDMAKSHVLKFTPASSGACAFRKLPGNLLLYTTGKGTPLYGRAYRVDPDNNLPERCEAMAHSVIDNLRVQEVELKGSPIVATDNHVALILFMLSHYAADAHMPLHCDARQFSAGFDLHSQMEQVWETQVKQHFGIDYADERIDRGNPPPRKAPDSNQFVISLGRDFCYNGMQGDGRYVHPTVASIYPAALFTARLSTLLPTMSLA